MSDSFAALQTVAHQAPLSMEFSKQRYWSGKKKDTGVGSHSLFQGILLTQGLNLGRLHCRSILYCLSHQGILISLSPLVNTSCGSPLDLTVIAIKKNIFLASNPNHVILKSEKKEKENSIEFLGF